MGGEKPYGGSWSTGSIPTAAQPQRVAALRTDRWLLNAPETHTESNLLSVSTAQVMGCAPSPIQTSIKRHNISACVKSGEALTASSSPWAA